jgi:hypothetical protein
MQRRSRPKSLRYRGAPTRGRLTQIRMDGALLVAGRRTYIGSMDYRKTIADSAPAATRSSGLHSRTAVSAKKRAKRRTKSKTGVVVFGSAKIEVELPGAAEIARNAKLGQIAFTRVKDRLLDAGVRLRRTKGVPLYYADPKQPTLIVQKLNGKVSRGVIRGGKFVAIE